MLSSASVHLIQVSHLSESIACVLCLPFHLGDVCCVCQSHVACPVTLFHRHIASLTLWGHLDVKLQFFSLFPFSPPAFGVVSLGRCAKPRSWRILQGKPDLVTNPSPPCTARGVLAGDVLLTRIPRGRTKGLSALSQRSRSHFSCEKRKKKKTLGFLFQADRIHFRSRSLVCSTPADSWWKQRDRRGGTKLFFLALFIFF